MSTIPVTVVNTINSSDLKPLVREVVTDELVKLRAELLDELRASLPTGVWALGTSHATLEGAPKHLKFRDSDGDTWVYKDDQEGTGWSFSAYSRYSGTETEGYGPFTVTGSVRPAPGTIFQNYQDVPEGVIFGRAEDGKRHYDKGAWKKIGDQYAFVGGKDAPRDSDFKVGTGAMSSTYRDGTAIQRFAPFIVL